MGMQEWCRGRLKYLYYKLNLSIIFGVNLQAKTKTAINLANIYFIFLDIHSAETASSSGLKEIKAVRFVARKSQKIP